jgi:hypothetical protein
VTVELGQGDAAVFHTDGVIEVHGADGLFARRAAGRGGGERTRERRRRIGSRPRRGRSFLFGGTHLRRLGHRRDPTGPRAGWWSI